MTRDKCGILGWAHHMCDLIMRPLLVELTFDYVFVRVEFYQAAQAGLQLMAVLLHRPPNH